MFGRASKRERELYERIIVILADQVDWYRANAGQPSMAPVQTGLLTAVPPPQQRPWVSEDEEVIEWQANHNVLDLDDARAALEQIGAMNLSVEDYS